MTKLIRVALLAAGISVWIALPVVDAVARKLGAEPFVYRATGPGDNLWNIAREVTPSDGTSRNQTMFAILRKNPDAFQGGNINFLRSGVELNMPTAAEARAEAAEQVDRLAITHRSNWSARRAAAPPLYELVPVLTAEFKTSAAASYLPEAEVSRASMPRMAEPLKSAPPAPLPPIEQIPPLAASQVSEASESNVSAIASAKADVSPPKSSTASKAPVWWGGSEIAVALAWLVLGSLAIAALFELLQRRSSADDWANKRKARARARSIPVEPADLSVVLPKIEHVSELVARSGAIGFAGRAPDEHEIDVKLRLAKAYVDVNRLRDAHQLLHEIRVEGAPHYRRFAERLLASPTTPVA